LQAAVQYLQSKKKIRSYGKWKKQESILKKNDPPWSADFSLLYEPSFDALSNRSTQVSAFRYLESLLVVKKKHPYYGDPMKLDFYRAFEDKHRGSRELIKTRLRVYLPFLTALQEVDHSCKALDLGCGRGEWLELLKEIEIDGHGVDLDDGMLQACRDLGLSVETGEAIAYLKSVPSESLSVVSAFHVVEHIPFTELQILVQEALRVLKPAGLLILETPNPENIRVGTANFYLDPTHIHPIPPPLLAFLPDYYGFYRTKIVRLQEAVELREDPAPNLLNMLGGVSPDYSVVAQKNGSEKDLAVFQNAFDVEYGITLDELATRYDVQQKSSLGRAVSEKENLQAELNGVRAELGGVRSDLGGIRSDLGRILTERANLGAEFDKTSTELAALQVKFNVRQREAAHLSTEYQKLQKTTAYLDMQLSRTKIELRSVYASTSWKVSAPVRKFSDFMRSVRYAFKSLFPLRTLPKRAILNITRSISMWIIVRPNVDRVVIAAVNYFPGVKNRLRKIVYGNTPATNSSALQIEEHIFMLPEVKSIYLDLVNKINNQKLDSSQG